MRDKEKYEEAQLIFSMLIANLPNTEVRNVIGYIYMQLSTDILYPEKAWSVIESVANFCPKDTEAYILYKAFSILLREMDI